MESFEAPGVEPVFLAKDQAIDYAQHRAGEICILDSGGNVDRVSSMRQIGSCHAVIRVYDDAGNLIETHERSGDFKEW